MMLRGVVKDYLRRTMERDETIELYGRTIEFWGLLHCRLDIKIRKTAQGQQEIRAEGNIFSFMF